MRARIRLTLFALGTLCASCAPAPPPPTSATGYQVVAVPQPGAIEGRITYRGPETDRVILVGRDPDACGELGSELAEGSLRVDETGGLADAVVRVEGLSGGLAPVPTERSLVNVRCLFEPRVLVAGVGDRLAVGSRDPALHSTRVRLEGRNLFNLTLPEPGSRIIKPLKEPGLLEVGCDAHDWMRAWIWVSESPYLALTGAQGGFRIEGVPPGEHDLVVWHERLGERRSRVSVPAGGQVRFDLAL